MINIFSDMVKDYLEVFMDDLSIFGNNFDSYLTNLGAILNTTNRRIFS